MTGLKVLWIAMIATAMLGCGADEGQEPLTITTTNGTTGNTSANNSASNNTSQNNTSANNTTGTNNPPTNNTTGTNNTPTNNTTPPVDTPNVDPNCIDGQFSEVLPNPAVDLSAPEAAFTPGSPKPFINAVLEARYPHGAFIVQQGLAEQQIGDCIEFFLFESDTSDDVISQLATVTHECGHFANIGQSGNDTIYIINEDLTLSCPGGSSQAGANLTPARSLINRDEFSQLRPPCVGSEPGCDFYADVYLDGDPNDAEFDSGDQGLDMLLEETVQYVNSLATAYAFNDYYASGQVSERDGIATFLWYLSRYLRMMRLDHPTAYENIVSDPSWREAILTTWGRAWIYLELTKDMRALGISDGEILPLALDQDLLDEIQLIRDREGC